MGKKSALCVNNSLCLSLRVCVCVCVCVRTSHFTDTHTRTKWIWTQEEEANRNPESHRRTLCRLSSLRWQTRVTDRRTWILREANNNTLNSQAINLSNRCDGGSGSTILVRKGRGGGGGSRLKHQNVKSNLGGTRPKFCPPTNLQILKRAFWTSLWVLWSQGPHGTAERLLAGNAFGKIGQDFMPNWLHGVALCDSVHSTLYETVICYQPQSLNWIVEHKCLHTGPVEPDLYLLTKRPYSQKPLHILSKQVQVLDLGQGRPDFRIRRVTPDGPALKASWSCRIWSRGAGKT